MEDKRLVIVTGGTRGIGADISRTFAKNGYNVLSVYGFNDGAAEQFRRETERVSPGNSILKADVSKHEEVYRVVEYAISKYGRIDVLINNAGMFDFSSIEDMTEEFLNKMLDVNFKSQAFMIQACAKYMKKNQFGRILNASSISSNMADVGLVAYGASKAAVNMLTKVCSAELAPFSITVNAYAPGIIHTDLTDQMIKERGHLQVKQIPLHRFGEGHEVAELLLFLASDKAGYITGEIIGIDGGMLKVQNPYRAYSDSE